MNFQNWTISSNIYTIIIRKSDMHIPHINQIARKIMPLQMAIVLKIMKNEASDRGL